QKKYSWKEAKSQTTGAICVPFIFAEEHAVWSGWPPPAQRCLLQTQDSPHNAGARPCPFGGSSRNITRLTCYKLTISSKCGKHIGTRFIASADLSPKTTRITLRNM